MAKSSRASSIKANNAALKSKVFGPVEMARNERLSAKLMELAAQPKPVREVVVAAVEEDAPAQAKSADAMELDEDASKAARGAKSGKGRIERKKSSRKAAMVFPKYKNGSRVSKTKSKPRK